MPQELPLHSCQSNFLNKSAVASGQWRASSLLQRMSQAAFAMHVTGSSSVNMHATRPGQWRSSYVCKGLQCVIVVASQNQSGASADPCHRKRALGAKWILCRWGAPAKAVCWCEGVGQLCCGDHAHRHMLSRRDVQQLQKRMK